MKTITLSLPFSERPYGPEQTLLYYDGPLLFWLPGMDSRRYLFALLPDEVGPWPFVVADLPAEAAQAIDDNKMTLQAAYTGPWPKYLLKNYDAEELVLEELECVPEDWLPGDVCLDFDTKAKPSNPS